MTEDVWSWVVAAYGAPGVAEQCLELQDAHDQNVPLLLWAAWAATQGPVGEGLASRAAEVARAWSEAAIMPLRSVRRRLKQALSEGDEASRLALREQVKAIELQSEKVLLEQLAALSVRSGAVPDSLLPVFILDAVLAVASAWSGGYPAEKLARLTQTLSDWQKLRYKG
ncbi:TIGR02444 family protein [Asticcacaulis sp.]|uniref:TIGR02444 family protein n=1 Tax=Asticcacaulis sp. TaxID=1872648 RepID=UPI003F7C1571